jgi:hypothetical protein
MRRDYVTRRRGGIPWENGVAGVMYSVPHTVLAGSVLFWPSLFSFLALFLFCLLLFLLLYVFAFRWLVHRRVFPPRRDGILGLADD